MDAPTSGPAPLIRCEALAKRYEVGGGTVHALRELTLSIEPGEFVAVMGPSGSGKSTFMNLVGCLDRPSSGRYWLGGEAVDAMDRDQLAAIRNRRIGFVFQQFNLLPRTTAVDNVELPLLYSGVPRAQRRERALKRLSQVGLAERVDHHPAQLSGGQQQRVAIARALVNDPALILADEPTGALDSRTSVEVMALLQSLNREGITIVLVTHEPDVAAFATRIIAFRDGRVVRDTPNEPNDAARALRELEVGSD
jgi:putative ABC transport system ATP-binding protein